MCAFWYEALTSPIYLAGRCAGYCGKRQRCWGKPSDECGGPVGNTVIIGDKFPNNFHFTLKALCGRWG